MMWGEGYAADYGGERERTVSTQSGFMIDMVSENGLGIV